MSLRLARPALFCVALGSTLFSSPPGHAHDTLAVPAREALSACYSQCTQRVVDLTYDAVSYIVGLYELGATSHALRQQTCLQAQVLMQVADHCRASCVDIEEARRTRASHARTRFYYEFHTMRRNIQDTGLWRDFRNHPEFGTSAFNRACTRYLAEVSAAQNTAKSHLVTPPPSAGALGLLEHLPLDLHAKLGEATSPEESTGE